MLGERWLSESREKLVEGQWARRPHFWAQGEGVLFCKGIMKKKER